MTNLCWLIKKVSPKFIDRSKEENLSYDLQIPWNTRKRKRRNENATSRKRPPLLMSLNHQAHRNPKKKRRKRKNEGRWKVLQKILSHPQLLPKPPIHFPKPLRHSKSLLLPVPQKLRNSLQNTQ